MPLFRHFFQRNERRLRRHATSDRYHNHQNSRQHLLARMGMEQMIQGAGWTLTSLYAAVQIEAAAHQFLYWCRPQLYQNVDQANGLTAEQLNAVRALPSFTAFNAKAVVFRLPEQEQTNANDDEEEEFAPTSLLSGPMWRDEDSSSNVNHNRQDQEKDDLELKVASSWIKDMMASSMTA